MAAKKTMPDLLPHLDEPWYDRKIGEEGLRKVRDATPGQRRSAARWLLNGAGGQESRLAAALATWEPDAVKPWVDYVARYDDRGIERLVAVDFLHYWCVTVGASDAAVDDLAAAIRKSPPKAAGNPGTPAKPPQARVQLLVGCDTPRALEHLGELGRKHDAIREICATCLVAIPQHGPAERRYVRRPQLIVELDLADEEQAKVKPARGLRRDVPTAKVLADPRGLGCPVPLRTVLEVDLGLLDGRPLAASPLQRLPLFTSLCEDCDADEETREYEWKPDPKHPKLVRFTDERKQKCKGHLPEDGEDDDEGGERNVALALNPHGDFTKDPGLRAGEKFGRLGGWPKWRQAYASVPEHCGKPMFFVAQANAAALGAYDATLFGFQCECGAGAQTVQST
jgi:hypothetical protein